MTMNFQRFVSPQIRDGIALMPGKISVSTIILAVSSKYYRLPHQFLSGISSYSVVRAAYIVTNNPPVLLSTHHDRTTMSGTAPRPPTRSSSPNAPHLSSVRFENVAFRSFRESLIPPFELTHGPPRFVPNPSTKSDLVRTIASLEIDVNLRSLRLTTPPPSLDNLDRRTIGLFRSEDTRGLLEIMIAWFDKAGHHIQGMKFFQVFLTLAHRHAPTCSLEYLVTLLFFCGMAKRNKSRTTGDLCSMVESRLDTELKAGKQLTENATVLLCISLHKLNFVVTNPLVLDHIFGTFMKKTEKIEPYRAGCLFGMIACLKVMRHARFSPDELCVRVAEMIVKLWSSLNATELYHLTAALANVNYCDRESLALAEKRLLEIFATYPTSNVDQRAHPSELLRIKDVQGITWACASLGHVFSSEMVEKIQEFLLRELKGVTSENQHGVYVDSLYALIIMGHHFPLLADKLMRPRTVDYLLRSGKGRMLTKMWIVEKAMNIELRAGLSVVSSLTKPDDFPFRSVFKDLDDRCFLRDLFAELKQRSKVDSFQCVPVYAIPRISISGLLLTRKEHPSKIHVEVLDSSVTSKPDSETLGLMRLKLRLMEVQNLRVVTLTEGDIRENKSNLLALILERSMTSDA